MQAFACALSGLFSGGKDGVSSYQKEAELSPAPVARAAAESFRGDINGLRAWAVMAVVLYHFGIAGVSGGFVGVDVFFVISGYLMTGIICSGLQQGNFSIWSFYLARARRILPALIVVAAVVLAVGWFIMMPKEYQGLGRHARESLLFSSNLRYLKESGYFDSDAHGKWLLHTWSLSVEWQFYLLLPVLLWIVWKLVPRRSALVAAHALLLLASFAVCVMLTQAQPSKAFYVLQSRAWEMLAGGLVFLLGGACKPSSLGSRGLEAAGLALIVAAILGLDAASRWPGWLALLPTLGAVLVLLAQRENSLWTGGRVVQWLGTRSYSIYLWHWPLVAALAYCEQLDSPLWVGGALAASLLLGQVSYAAVEVPARRALSRVTPRRAALYLLVVLAVAAVAAQLVRRDGFPQRLPAAVAEIEAQRGNRNPRLDECLGEGKACVFGGERIAAMLVGDSHADAVVTAAQAALPDERQGVYFRGVSSCLLVFGAGIVDAKEPNDCSRLKQDLQTSIDTTHPGVPVIVVNRTAVYAHGVTAKAAGLVPGRPWVFFSKLNESATPEFLEEFRQHYLDSACRIARMHPLFLVRPIPEMPVSVPGAMGKAMLLGGHREVSLPIEQYHRRQAFIWRLQDEAHERCGAQILDPLPYLCDDKVCRGSKNGLPIYADGDHLNEFGNRLLVPMFAKVFAAYPLPETPQESSPLR